MEIGELHHNVHVVRAWSAAAVQVAEALICEEFFGKQVNLPWPSAWRLETRFAVQLQLATTHFLMCLRCALSVELCKQQQQDQCKQPQQQDRSTATRVYYRVTGLV